MPSIPKWLANTMEKVAGKSFHPVSVTHIEYYTPELKLVRFEGNIGETSFKAGNVVEFRVSETEFRHYTPSRYDTENQLCEIIFYLHGKGPGSEWAKQLEIGTQTKLIGPGGKMSYQTDFKEHFVFGDETSLSLMLCIAQETLKNNHQFFALAELDKDHLNWPIFLVNENIKSTRNDFENPAKPAIELLSQWEDYFEEYKRDTCFYLTGRAKSIQNFRRFLMLKGVEAKHIKTYPYWAEGKKGL